MGATLLRQSTAVTIRFGPFLDKTDGVSEETGLTPGIEVSKNHAAFAARSGTTVAHDAEGWYGVELNTTDTNTLGPLVVKAQDSATHLPVYREFMVVPAHVYDGLVAGTDYLQTDAVQVEGADATDTIRDAVVDDATRIDGSAVNALAALAPGSTIAAASDVPTAAANADAVADELLSGHTTPGSLGQAISDVLTDTGTSIPAQITGLNNLSAAQVNAEVDAALGDYDPPTKAEMDAAFAALADFDPTTDTFEGAETYRDLMRLLRAFVAGKTNGGGSSPVNFRDVADGKNRIAMTVDANGNRSSVTVDAT